MAKTGRQQPSVLELTRAELGAEYTPISPEHNAIKLILQDLGHGDLGPTEVEALCRTVKVPGLDGFTRLDQLPCGCERIYRGKILGAYQDSGSLNIRIGGLEGVKACPRHMDLISGISLKEPPQDLPIEQGRFF